MLFIPFTLFLACGDKTADTANTETNTQSEESDTSSTDTGSSETTDTNSDDTNDTSESDSNSNEVTPNVGIWTVYGPEFTTNTCGGGEEFPDPRSMALSVNNTTVTMVIEEVGEHTYEFNCNLMGTDFTCNEIIIENAIPVLPCTLTYTHMVQGRFTENNSLEADYSIVTSSDGGSGCSESNLGFTTPCEQVRTMTGSFEQ